MNTYFILLTDFLCILRERERERSAGRPESMLSVTLGAGGACRRGKKGDQDEKERGKGKKSR